MVLLLERKLEAVCDISFALALSLGWLATNPTAPSALARNKISAAAYGLRDAIVAVQESLGLS